MASVRTPDPNPGWLSEIALEETRSRVPILYVVGIPVRVDSHGRVEHVGLLLRGSVLARADELGVRHHHLSLSHDAGIASAVVVLES